MRGELWRHRPGALEPRGLCLSPGWAGSRCGVMAQGRAGVGFSGRGLCSPSLPLKGSPVPLELPGPSSIFLQRVFEEKRPGGTV